MTKRQEPTLPAYTADTMLITVKEAASISGYSENFLRKLLKKGVLRDVGLCGRVRMVRSEFLAVICRKGGKVFR